MSQKKSAAESPDAKLALRAVFFVVYAIPALLVVNALARFVRSLFTADHDVLPHVFIALAATMAVLALHAFYASVRSMFGTAGTSHGLRASLPERAALNDEKNALLRAIKDIAFERDVGKLSQEEFERLDRSYRLRAKEVLRKLDEGIEPYIERAERLLEEREVAAPKKKAERAPVLDEQLEIGAAKKTKRAKKKAKRRMCPSCATSNAPDAEWCKSCGASVAPIACPKCSAPNEPDAKFCNKCAAPMKSESAPEQESAPEAAPEEKE